MKKIIRKLSLLLLAVIVFNACQNKEEDATPTTESNRGLDGDPCGVVLDTRFVSKSGTKVTFEVDLAVINGSGNEVPNLANDDIKLGDTNVKGVNLDFNVDASSQTEGTKIDNFATTLLLDQSGSIANTDPENLRIEAAKIFCGALGAKDSVLLSAFASGGGKKIPFDLSVYGNFTNDGKTYYPTLDDLKNKIGGATPLYKAIYAMIGYVDKDIKNANKSVVVFTDGEDTEGGVAVSTLISFAKSKKVKVHVVALGKEVNLGTLGDIANQTGGCFIWAADARQLITIFGTFSDLLKGKIKFYKTKCTVDLKSTVSVTANILIYVKIKLSKINETDKDKVIICHKPPGNPSNSKTITVSKTALQAHLAHGDSQGACGSSDDGLLIPVKVPLGQ
ncbi:MAG: VWA domain-containing protein [Cytophagales bacterium]|nr:MAG: VWA domain-containing protein [Cytophagales bacterium]